MIDLLGEANLGHIIHGLGPGNRKKTCPLRQAQELDTQGRRLSYVHHFLSCSRLSRTRKAVILRISASGNALSSGNWMAPLLVLNPARSFAKALIGEGVG